MTIGIGSNENALGKHISQANCGPDSLTIQIIKLVRPMENLLVREGFFLSSISISLSVLMLLLPWLLSSRPTRDSLKSHLQPQVSRLCQFQEEMRPKLSTGSVPGVFYIGMEGQLVDFFDMIPGSVALQLSL